jgi:PAS domain S-box-containing protein
VREDNGLIVDVNDKVYTVLGFERDEVIGKISKDFRFFVHEEERSRYYEEYGQKGFIQIECWWYKKDRSIISVLISSSRIKIDEAAYTISVIKDISDRKAAEEKFLKAFELSPDLMLIFRERDMVLVEANSKLETLLGYDRRSLFGLSAFNMDLWADQQARDIYFNDLQQNDVVSVEAVLRRKDRSMFFGSIASERIALAGESHILVSVRDITDKKVAEEKILQREANLNAVINNTGFFVWSLDTDFRITAVNEPFKQYALEVYGLRLHVGNNILQLFSQRMESKQVALWEKWYRQVLSGEILKKQERRNLRDFQYSLSPIKSKDSIMGITVFVEDITAQKEAQEKILENEARLNAIMNNTNMAIWSVDTDGNITAVNKVFQESILKDFNIHCEIGQNIIELMRGHMRQEIADLWIDLYQRCFDGEIVMEEYTTDGVTMRCSLHPIIEHDCVIGASIYAQDITERVQKEEQIRKSAVELAEANKKIGELKLMALRSAMNPHFIFNALNSIQYFIAKNDRQNAISYLSTFSKLIRGILTHAVNTRTSLANELNLLKYYINLEMLRFENKFDVEWNIESNLDLENIEVPSLLIQPFVENAILHGLYNKVGKGILKLTVRTDSDKIWFVVEDNGIGRAAAQALRLQQFPTHQSLGTPLTEERLRLINQRESIAYTVEDLFDADHLPAGTKVSIGIKI